jgi:hypothetical protein
MTYPPAEAGGLPRSQVCHQPKGMALSSAEAGVSLKAKFVITLNARLGASYFVWDRMESGADATLDAQGPGEAEIFPQERSGGG